MGKFSNIPWWSSVFSKTDTVPDIDCADMGTAFGLDASMAPPDWDVPAETQEIPAMADRLNGRSAR